MQHDPDGEVDINCFALEHIKWLEQHDRKAFEFFSRACLEDANSNYVRTGQIFNSFDLLREIIEYTEKKITEEKMITNSN